MTNDDLKNVCIIYNQPLTQVQGINYVNNSFVQGQPYFFDKGLELTRIYGADGYFDCNGHEGLDTIGSNIGSSSYTMERWIRTFLRRLLSSKFLFGAMIKYYFNCIVNARKSVKRYLESDNKVDYIIFQDFHSAEYYLKHKGVQDNAKAILILHCGDDPLEQAIPVFLGMFKYRSIENKVRNRLAFVTNNVDKVVFLSQYAVSSSPLDAEKKTYIFNGIEDIPHIEILDKHDVLNIVTVASTIEHKGQAYVIGAINKLPDQYKKRIHYYVVGGGTELPQYKQMMEEYNLQDYVTLMGARNDVADILKRMDVFILPSLSEGMPMSIIEAMRQGLYIVATPVGGIPEMIRPEYGFFTERNEDRIASDLMKIIDENLVTHRAKIASRKSYEENFTLKGMVYNYSDILNSL